MAKKQMNVSLSGGTSGSTSGNTSGGTYTITKGVLTEEPKIVTTVPKIDPKPEPKVVVPEPKIVLPKPKPKPEPPKVVIKPEPKVVEKWTLIGWIKKLFKK